MCNFKDLDLIAVCLSRLITNAVTSSWPLPVIQQLLCSSYYEVRESFLFHPLRNVRRLFEPNAVISKHV